MRRLIRQPEDGVGQPASEDSLSLNCLKARCRPQNDCHHARQRLVVLDPGVLLVRVLLRVLVRRVGRDLAGISSVISLLHAVVVGPRDVAELVVEGLEDVGEPIELRLGLAARRRRSAPARSRRPVGELDLASPPASRRGSCPCRWLRGCPSRGPPPSAPAASGPGSSGRSRASPTRRSCTAGSTRGSRRCATNALALPLKSTWPSSSSCSLYVATQASRIGSSLSRSAPLRYSVTNCVDLRPACRPERRRGPP